MAAVGRWVAGPAAEQDAGNSPPKSRGRPWGSRASGWRSSTCVAATAKPSTKLAGSRPIGPRFFGGDEGDDAAGYDLCVKTPQTEWLYEVKSSLEDTCEFELNPNEMRVAASMSRRGRQQYRIFYVPFVFSPARWFVLELPNPMDDGTRNRFKQVGRGSVRFRFEHSTVKRASS